MTIKMAPQNELSSYFFQIITQENYPRKSIIFDVPLQTHVSLWDKEQGIYDTRKSDAFSMSFL